MGELIQFPAAKKEVQDNKLNESSGYNEKNAIAMLSSERFKFLLEIKKSNPIILSSETYRNALESLSSMTNVEIAEMLSNMPESEIKKKPTYFTVAFNILLKK